MNKIFFSIISFLVSVQSAFAEWDMTTTNFTINLKEIDPLKRPGSTPGWQEALLVVLNNVSSLLLFMIPIIAIVSGLIAGYYYIFSAWDSEKAGRAKNIIKWNIIAIVVAFMSFSIIKLVASLFS